jgi:glycosyltransferase involved in cell wall biosynthesis
LNDCTDCARPGARREDGGLIDVEGIPSGDSMSEVDVTSARPQNEQRERRVLHVMRMAGISGSERHLLYLTEALPKHGWRCSVLIPTPRPDRVASLVERLKSSCESVHVVQMRGDIAPALLSELVRALRNGRYDIAHAHLVHADWYLACASIFAHQIPLVSTKHNHDSFRQLAPFRVVERAAMRRYRAVIAISESLKTFTVDIARVPAVEVVPYGVPLSTRPPAERRAGPTLRILGVGRLTRQKGFDVAIRAFRFVRIELPQTQLEIAGEGEERESLSRLINELGLTDAVSLLGERRDIPELMEKADVLIHPARWEGFGLVLLEAMTAGLPIVASRAGAIPEVVDDEVTGLLISPEDPQAFAAALVRILRTPALGRQFAAAGSSRLRRRFSVERMAAHTAAVYESSLKPSGRRP